MASPTANTPGPQRRWVELAAVTAFFTLLTLLMTWPWALHMGEAINPFGDVIVQATSLRWNVHALFTNPLGLFEAPFFYPYAHSLAFSENLLGQTLIGLPFLLLADNAALAANFNILLSFVLTGLFTYLLVRDLTGSRAAGILSGVAFAFCPFRFMQMGHLHMLATQWFPFTLWALGRALGVRGQKLRITHYALFSFGFIAMGLSSVYYMYFLALAVVIYVVWWTLFEARQTWEGRVPWVPLLLRLGLSLIIIGLALGPVFLPYLQSNRDLGFSRSTFEVQNWAAEWSYFGKVLQSNWFYGKVLAPAMTSISGERELFPGIVAILLALVGIAWGRGRSRFFYVLLGLFSLVLAFGLSGHIPGTSLDVLLPYAFFYDWIPGFKALRVPVRFAVLVDLSIYVLAGYGLKRILDFGTNQSKIQNLKSKIVAPVLTALILLEFVNPLDTDNRRDITAQLQAAEPYGWLARPENAGTVLELPITAGQDDVWYTFFATRHWQPLVNGWSSFVPPGTVRLKQALANFPDPLTVSLLQGLEVRHVVVHLWQFPSEVQADLKRRLDATSQLEMVKQTGDNYVYRLTPDPWLRQIATQVGNGTLWVGEARHDSMPTLEVLAYALMRWGVPADHIGGNINIGYRPIGSLPFGTAPDYALVPAAGGLPLGLELMQTVEGHSNAAVRLLKRDPLQLKTYNFTSPDAPSLASGDMRFGLGLSDVTFGGDSPTEANMGKERRALSLRILSFTSADITVQMGDIVKDLHMLPGLTRYDSPGAAAPYTLTIRRKSGDVKVLRAELWSGGYTEGWGALISGADRMPLEVTPSRSGSTLDARIRVVPTKGGGDFTATIDVYIEPWGTHPEGHFGSWSVVLPADGAAHDFAFQLDPITKNVTTTRDSQPVETFAWVGPPTQGDFRASLSISRGNDLIANVPLYTFTLNGARLTDWQPEPTSLSIVQP